MTRTLGRPSRGERSLGKRRRTGFLTPLMYFLRSRRIVITLAAGAAWGAAFWALATVLDNAAVDRAFGRFCIALITATAGHTLQGQDLDLDRAAAVDWRPRRAAHVVLITAAAYGIVAATHLTGHPLGGLTEAARNAVGASGLLALGAATIGASRAWIPPVLWIAGVPWIWDILWSIPNPPSYVQALVWPAQPLESGAALATAMCLGVIGLAAYAVLGPRADASKPITAKDFGARPAVSRTKSFP